ncbi:MAG: hypothetical protein QM762_17830 [Chryseolinea sp.]
MLSVQSSITILKELRDQIIPLADEELALLEQSLLQEGCRDPLVIWSRDDGQTILVDGHNRYKICQKHSLPFKAKTMKFRGLEEVKLWMIDNQMGRRNLSPDQLSYYRGLKYNSLKKQKGGYLNVKSKGQIESSTSESLAKVFNVSESTVKRDAKFALGLDIIGRANPKLKTKILIGETSVRKADVQVLGDAENTERLTIKNEADLYNKAKQIRTNVLNSVAANLSILNSKKERGASNDEDDSVVFLDQADKLRRIKGMILSAMNRAINEKNVKAMRELKKLVEKLEGELFE